jgi:hypothetical protein
MAAFTFDGGILSAFRFLTPKVGSKVLDGPYPGRHISYGSAEGQLALALPNRFDDRDLFEILWNKYRFKRIDHH